MDWLFNILVVVIAIAWFGAGYFAGQNAIYIQIIKEKLEKNKIVFL